MEDTSSSPQGRTPPPGASRTDRMVPAASAVLTDASTPVLSVESQIILAELASMRGQLSVLESVQQMVISIQAQMVAMQQRQVAQEQQLSGLNERLSASEETARALKLENAALTACIKQMDGGFCKLQAQVDKQQQQLTQLEQRPASYAAAVAGPAPTTSPTTSEYLNAFRMPVGKHITPGAPYQTLVQQLRTTLGGLLKEGDAPFQVSHVEAVRVVAPKARPSAAAGSAAAPAPAPFVVFKVSEGDALQISKLRTQLAGTGVTISDWLTPEENQRRLAFMPQFRAARAEKLKTYWRRAQLFVAGVEVSLPSPVAAATAAA